MTSLLGNLKFMWVEFTGQPGLVDFLEANDFMLFDSEYFFLGDPAPEATEHYEVSLQNVALSVGSNAWFGFKKKSWKNIAQEMIEHRRQFRLVQTDLLYVNKRHLKDFISAIPYL